MKRILSPFLLVLVLFSTGKLPAAEFRGEIYRVDRYGQQVVAKGPDLSEIKTGMTLYVADAEGKLTATIEVTRFFTTVIEAKVLTGKLESLKPGMPVYTKAQWDGKKTPVRQVSFREKEHDFYYWDAEISFSFPPAKRTAVLETVIIMPSLIDIIARGSASSVRLPDDEITGFGLRNGQIVSVTLKSGEKADLTGINFTVPPERFPRKEESLSWQESKLVVRQTNLVWGIDNAVSLRLKTRKAGTSQDSGVPLKPLRTGTFGGIEFVLLPAGIFLMGGSEFDQSSEPMEKPRRPVEVGSFWISKYEITQEQYQAVMKKNPSVNRSKKEKNLPVDNVSWREAKTFSERFGRLHKLPARLPFEKEWEYACRAGSQTRFYWGEDIDEDYFWHTSIAYNRTHPVGLKKPNAAGLHDMAGNVWEWCEDWFQPYPGSSAEHREFGETHKVLRGGGFTFDAFYCRSSFRGRLYPDSANHATGIRLVIPADSAESPR